MTTAQSSERSVFTTASEVVRKMACGALNLTEEENQCTTADYFCLGPW